MVKSIRTKWLVVKQGCVRQWETHQQTTVADANAAAAIVSMQDTQDYPRTSLTKRRTVTKNETHTHSCMC